MGWKKFQTCGKCCHCHFAAYAEQAKETKLVLVAFVFIVPLVAPEAGIVELSLYLQLSCKSDELKP